MCVCVRKREWVDYMIIITWNAFFRTIVKLIDLSARRHSGPIPSAARHANEVVKTDCLRLFRARFTL